MVFILAVPLISIIPINEVPRELIGYIAYVMPITATIVAGEALFADKFSSSVTKLAFIQSLLLYIFGAIFYVLYISWYSLEKYGYAWETVVFINSIIMGGTSILMYKEFKKDGKNPFWRSIFGGFFAMASILSILSQFFNSKI